MAQKVYYDCKTYLNGEYARAGKLVSRDRCEGCFNSTQSTLIGGRYQKRAQCVMGSGARRVMMEEKDAE